jgi:hypothetical protein
LQFIICYLCNEPVQHLRATAISTVECNYQRPDNWRWNLAHNPKREKS